MVHSEKDMQVVWKPATIVRATLSWEENRDDVPIKECP